MGESLVIPQMSVPQAIALAKETYQVTLSPATVRNWCATFAIGHKVGSTWFVYVDAFNKRMGEIAEDWQESEAYIKQPEDGVETIDIKDAIDIGFDAGIKLTPHKLRTWCKQIGIGFLYNGKWSIYKDKFIDVLNGK